MNRHPAHILLLKAARALELLIAAVILLVIVCGAVFLFRETGRTLLLSQRPSPWGISSPPHCCW
ncbi:MAG: hypothetical protein ACLT1A_08180 [Dysosmobacter sp.]